MNRISFLNRGYAFKGLLAVNKGLLNFDIRQVGTRPVSCKF